MGGDFGEDDERMITRLENSQYDPAAAALAAQQQQQMNAIAAGGMHHHQQQQQQHQYPANTVNSGAGMSPFSRPPSFPAPPAAFQASSSPSMMYAPGPPYAPPTGVSSSSPSMKHQSPLYGHPNSVPPSQQQQQQGLQPPQIAYGGGPMMPASVPPHVNTAAPGSGCGGRIMSPTGVGVGMGGNPSTPLGPGGPNMGAFKDPPYFTALLFFFEKK